MKTSLRRISLVLLATTLASLCATAQQHKWAGRELTDTEWAIHDRLAALPSHGVFDTLDFELQGNAVTLSGKVLKESVQQNAESAVKRVAGVDKVINKIEVLPDSKRDDALRMNVYRAIYEHQPLDKYGTRQTPPIHIIVKGGWVSLEGLVDSAADRRMVYRRALGVTSHVSDNLRVAPEGA
jgi:hyperosmotically inducible periplasmic protein